MSQLLPQAVYLLAMLVAIWAWVRHGLEGLVLAYAFFVPWFGLQVNVGLTVNVDRLLAALAILVVLTRYGTNGFRGWGLFAAYAAIDTVVQSISLPETAGLYAPLRGQWRWAFQLPMWGLIIGPGAIIGALGNGSFVRRILDVTTASVGILAILAMVQSLAYASTGVDIFPIGVLDPTSGLRTGIIEGPAMLPHGQGVIRTSAMAGEPKHLAYVMAVTLSILLLDLVYGQLLSLRRTHKVATATVCVLALITTYSTQGLILAAVNAAIILATAPKDSIGAWRGQAFAVLFVLVGVAALSQVPGLQETLFDRTFTRIRAEGAVEDWNLAVLGYLLDHPESGILGVGLGNIHLHAASYVPLEAESYMLGQVFVAKSGFLRLWSEVGLVGLGIFLASYLRPVVMLWKAAPARRRGLEAGVAVLAFVFLIDFLASGDNPFSPFVMAGLAQAARRQGT